MPHTQTNITKGIYAMLFQKIAALACTLTLMLSPAPNFVCSAAAAAADTPPTETVESTEKTSDDFLTNAAELNSTTAYHTDDGTAQFLMNGRQFYQGLVFSTNSSYKTAYAQYLVEDISTISFTIGHIDNSALRNATLQIYLDEKLEDEVALNALMNLKDYTLDVSEASVLQFTIYESNAYSTSLQYGLGDFKVDDSAPKYQSEPVPFTYPEMFIRYDFNSSGRTRYDGESDLEGFNMNGRTFHQGLVFSTDYSEKAAYTQHNVESLMNISFTIGHIDNSALRNATLQIYLDGKLEDEVALTPMMNLKNYTLNVAKAKVLRFYVYETDNYTGSLQYALADFHVNASDPLFPNEIPSYHSAEQFIKSSFNSSGRTRYDGESDLQGFDMNGRTFYQGLVFSTDYSQKAAYTQYNVEKVDSLSFTIGHVDNSALRKATLQIYLDGKLDDEIGLTPMMNLKDYTLDVSDAKVLRFYVYETDNYTSSLQYALADFTVDTYEPEFTNNIPSYKSAEKFIQSSFNSFSRTRYDGESDLEGFDMNGRTFDQGLVFSTDYSQKAAYTQYNVEKVDSLSFIIGHVDNSKLRKATLQIYLDGKLHDEVALTPMMNLQDYTLDVSDAKVLRFYVYETDDYIDPAQYGLADFTVDTYEPEFTNDIPSYKSAEKFIQSSFNSLNRTRYDGESDLEGFDMNGRTFYQGIVFSTDYSKKAAYTQYNVEKVDSLSFIIGHVDNSKLRKATLQIYLDGKLHDEVALTPTMNLQDYTLDVSDAKVLRFYVYENDDYIDPAQYGLADFTVNTYIPEYSNVTPSYDTAESFVQSSFNSYNRTRYDGESDLESFDMNGKTFYQGIVFSTNYSNKYGYTQYNVEKLDAVSFTIGHVDNSKLRNAKLQIYLDNVLTDEIELTPDMEPEFYHLNVSDASVLRFYLYESDDYIDSVKYGIGDFKIIQVDENPEVRPGDLNRDDTISIADAVILTRFIAENAARTSLYQPNADVNGDQRLDITDVHKLLSMIAKTTTPES